MFDKLKFWKKDDDFSMGEDFSAPKGMPEEFNTAEPSFSQHSTEEPSFSQQPSYDHFDKGPLPGTEQYAWKHQEQEQAAPKDREMELILAKLDAIKSELDSMHQRIRNIEQQADKSKQNRYW